MNLFEHVGNRVVGDSDDLAVLGSLLRPHHRRPRVLLRHLQVRGQDRGRAVEVRVGEQEQQQRLPGARSDGLVVQSLFKIQPCLFEDTSVCLKLTSVILLDCYSTLTGELGGIDVTFAESFMAELSSIFL